MYLPEFELCRPRSLDEALTLKCQHEGSAWYAGGTELIPLMKLGLAAPTRLIDIKRAPELRTLGVNGDLVIGAGVTHRGLERDPTVRASLPSLSKLEGAVANVRVRNAGSLGGNLCFAEPHSDPATLLTALEARVTLVSTRGSRELSLSEFLIGPFETALETDELLTQITVPDPANVVDVALERRAFRERPTVNVAVVATRDALRVVVGAVGPRPVRAAEAERLLNGHRSDPASLLVVTRRAATAAAEAAGAYDEAAASAAYKEHLTAVLVERALRRVIGGR